MLIKNLTFIVIARNEAFALSKCLDSIVNMPLKDCEVICVDSDSADNTLQIMKAYIDKIENLKIIHCSGLVNAAIARNTGLKYSTKKYVFFVDGDIELNPQFIIEAIKKISEGKADAVTGKLNEIIYCKKTQAKIKQWIRREFMTTEKKCVMTGGIFFTHKSMIDKIGEWDTSFIRGQDLEYTLRISRNGSLIQLPIFIGTHHTIETQDRSWEHYRKGYPLLYGKLLIKAVDNPYLFYSVLRRNRGLSTFLLFLFFTAGLFVLIKTLNLPSIAIVYGISACLSADIIYSLIVKKWSVSQWLLHNYLTPPLILAGLFYRSKPNLHAKTTLKVIH